MNENDLIEILLNSDDQLSNVPLSEEDKALLGNACTDLTREFLALSCLEPEDSQGLPLARIELAEQRA